MLWWLLFVAVAAWVLLRTRAGNWIFAVGGNAASARAVGVPVNRVKIGLFMTVGLTAWFTGMHLLFAFNTVQSGEGVGQEFRYIIAAVIGGALLTGGHGSAVGSAIGAFILGMATQSIVYAGWQPDWFFFHLGLMLLLATLANTWARSFATRWCPDDECDERRDRGPGGANGVGKSTLIKIVAGLHTHDEGTFEVDGEALSFSSPREALDRRIATVYQDLAVVGLMPVWRNFFLGSERTKGAWPARSLDIPSMRTTASEELRKMGIDLPDIDQPVGTLSGGQRQCVAIARAVYFGARALIPEAGQDDPGPHARRDRPRRADPPDGRGQRAGNADARAEALMVLQVGVIGAGNIGSYHIQRLARQISGARVAAVFDVAADRAAQIAASAGARAHRDAHELIADDAIDAVVIASPGDTHAEFTLACIAAAKPVLCEKPLATGVDDCVKVLEAEMAHGSRLVQVGFMRRFDVGYRLVRAAIDGGDIGEPLVLHCIHRNATVPDTFTSDMVQTDSVIHEIDTARWLLGEELIAATVLTPKRSPLAARHLADPQLVMLESQSGVMVQVEVFVNAGYGYDVRCEVVGSAGTAELETPAVAALTRDGRRGRRVPADWKERFGAAFHAEIQQWVDALAAGAVTGPSAWDGYAATAVAVSCVEALQTGRRVEVALVDAPALYSTAAA